MVDKDSSRPRHDKEPNDELEVEAAGHGADVGHDVDVDAEGESERFGAEATEPIDELAVAQAEIQALQDGLRRSQAELINFRRRTNREKLERMDTARADMLRGLLPVLDDLDRAVHQDTDNVDAYREGVELILRALHDTLRQLDVIRLDPGGEPFDPHHHEAVEQEPTEDDPPGHVTRVYQPGYLFKDRLVRPATVAVSVAVTEPGEVADEED